MAVPMPLRPAAWYAIALQGYRAQRAGQKSLSCPWDPSTDEELPQAMAWMRGYIRARVEGGMT